MENKTEESKIEFFSPEDIERTANENKKKEEELKKVILKRNRGKIISVIIAVIYLLLAAGAGGGEAFLRMILFLMIPMACIWVPDIMGGYTGSSMGIGGSTFRRINAVSPSSIVKFMGWVILLFPVWGSVIVTIYKMS